MQTTRDSDESSRRVRIDREGGLGILTLQRPEALNAIDLPMIQAMHGALAEWAGQDDVTAVVLRGAGDRGFCAGGDVRGLHQHLMAGHPERVERFFRAEYALNDRIARYRHPIVALADGITMGGGIGLAGHAAIRIVTERSQLAMPETRIGFTPDVGGSWLLARAPGRIGEYLALTGATMTAADAVATGFADHLVEYSDLDALIERLRHSDDPHAVVREHARPAPSGDLARDREWIDDAFGEASVADILAALRRRPEPKAARTADDLEASAPTALTITLAAVRRARTLPDLRAALAQEYGLVMWFGMTQPDLVEGIRAQLVDKDRTPRWQPSTLDDLPADLVDQAFAFTPPTPLWD